MSEQTRDWVSDPAQVAVLVNKWRGASAQGWAYSVSHSQLLIRVQWPKEPVDIFGLFLLFKGCSQVSFQDVWRDFNLRIQEFKGELGPEFVAVDGDRLCVRFRYGPFACETEDFLKFHGI